MALADALKCLSKPKTRTALDLRSALAKLDVRSLEAEVDRLETERRRLLVHGTDAEVLAIGTEITSANLAAERGAAAVDELNRLVAEADQREAAAALADTEATATRLREEIQKAEAEINSAADRIGALLKEARGKIESLQRCALAISKARGEPVGRMPDALHIRSRAVERIGRP